MAAPTAKYRFLGLDHAGIIKPTDPTLVTPGMTEYDIHFANSVTWDALTTDTSFEGDNQTVRKTMLNGMTVRGVADTYDLAAIGSAYEKDEVTVGVPAGVDGRTYFGDSTETAGVKCGFVAQVYAENLTSNLIDTVRVVVPLATLTVITPPAMAFGQKGQLNMSFTSEKTETYIDGTALPSVPSGGCMWFLDRISP